MSATERMHCKLPLIVRTPCKSDRTILSDEYFKKQLHAGTTKQSISIGSSNNPLLSQHAPPIKLRLKRSRTFSLATRNGLRASLLVSSKARGVESQRQELRRINEQQSAADKRRSKSIYQRKKQRRRARKTGKRLLRKRSSTMLDLSGSSVNMTEKAPPKRKRMRWPGESVLRMAENLVHKILVCSVLPCDYFFECNEDGSEQQQERVTIIDVMYNYAADVIDSVLSHHLLRDKRIALMREQVDKDGNNVLHIAAFNGEVDLFNDSIIPLFSGDSQLAEIINATNHKQCTPLDLAIYDDQVPMVVALLKQGAALGPALYTQNREYFDKKVSPDIKALLDTYGVHPHPIVDIAEPEVEEVVAQPAIKPKENRATKLRKAKNAKRFKRKKRKKKTLLTSMTIQSINGDNKFQRTDSTVYIPKLHLNGGRSRSGSARRLPLTRRSARWSEVITIIPDSKRESARSSRHFMTHLTDDFFQCDAFHAVV